MAHCRLKIDTTAISAHTRASGSVRPNQSFASTRGDQKVLQFSMMYKWHKQNNYIIFNVISLFQRVPEQERALYWSDRLAQYGRSSSALWRWLPASEMTCIVSSGALNSTHSLTPVNCTRSSSWHHCRYPPHRSRLRRLFQEQDWRHPRCDIRYVAAASL